MKIAFIGLGNMGGPMALNLLKAGHEIQAFDLSKPACDKLAADGVAIACDALSTWLYDDDAATLALKYGPVYEELRDELAKTNAEIMGKPDFDPFYGAPAILIVLADKSCRTATYDGSLVMGNLMLAAASLGLGSCGINRAKEEFESDEGKALLRQWGIEGDWVGVGHCILGYPAADPKPAAPRKPDYIVKV